MQIIKARVDGQIFLLRAGTDIAALKSSIVAAVRHGADFVDFDTAGRGLISVLITPTIPVRFEIVERSQEQVDDWQENPPSIDGLVDAETYLTDHDH
ncbi:hypothetical protein C5B96_13560 [Subtercola sp. Z020]|uniref:hypothetical protein n=1 Tax=Subtercola sp. Z020 TaxID=2080582 RepID=UPI000CE8EA66|nr:hypothetical protein [Subtercola sp. Z020]PPF79065.1 hypothetical protein C5B96_13560 [Subtercola sp. Z020]